MLSFHYYDLGGKVVALQSAENYRYLRQRGITVRKTINMLIATSCISHGLQLLHADRDFDAMEEHLDLQVISLGLVVNFFCPPPLLLPLTAFLRNVTFVLLINIENEARL